MVFDTPGKTLPNARFWAPVTVMGDCTVAVAEMLPFTPCARTEPAASSARTSVASAAFEAVYMMRLPICRVVQHLQPRGACLDVLYQRNRQGACQGAWFFDDRQYFIQCDGRLLHQDGEQLSSRHCRDCRDS